MLVVARLAVHTRTLSGVSSPFPEQTEARRSTLGVLLFYSTESLLLSNDSSQPPPTSPPVDDTASDG